MDEITAIQKQIDDASLILARLSNLSQIPTRGYKGPGEPTDRKLYDKAQVKQIEEEISKWQYSTKAVLAAFFPSVSDHQNAFERTIVSHMVYFDAKEELESEVKDGRNVLSAIIQEESLKMELQSNPFSKEESAKKKPLVFVSHCGSQRRFVTYLVELLEKCGFSRINLFCSSVPGFNIDLDEDIIETLRKKFVDYDLYVLYVFSSDFFDSAYCLNEMGAAWVLQVDYSIIITQGMDETKIDGVVSKTKTRISFKDTGIQLDDRMIQLREKLLAFAGLPKVDEINWNRYYNTFKQQVNDIPVVPQSKNKPIKAFATGTLDSVVNEAINKLGEFTIKELQDETGFKDYHHVAEKVQALVHSGILEEIGSMSHRKYRQRIISK